MSFDIDTFGIRYGEYLKIEKEKAEKEKVNTAIRIPDLFFQRKSIPHEIWYNIVFYLWLCYLKNINYRIETGQYLTYRGIFDLPPGTKVISFEKKVTSDDNVRREKETIEEWINRLSIQNTFKSINSFDEIVNFLNELQKYHEELGDMKCLDFFIRIFN